ncbi:hypothetical protein AB0D33_36190 [Streptomyces sp. NPDC048404]|uniref:hypothetical protein n=1 Tax=unclassified Streptomyces TaxID=2593676 RepID=UPI00341BF019
MSPRRVRFPAAVDVPAPPKPVPRIGPVAFTLRFDREEHHFDLSQLPCPRLVRALAGVLSGIGGDEGTRHRVDSFRQMITSVRLFVGFVAAAEPAEAEDLTAGDLEPELLDAFEEHLVNKFPEGSGRP